MSQPPRPPVFLARETYRRRRLMDAARLLPFLGVFAFALPVLWFNSPATSGAKIYLFVAWLALIVMTGVLAARLNREPPEDEDGGSH